MERLNSHLPLYLLLLTQCIIWWLTGDVFVQDELSALSRTRFEGFTELIEQGVLTDFHPALVQTFLWIWTGLVGMSSYMVKLPSLLCALSSIWLVHRIGRRLFSPQVAWMAGAYMVFAQYYILYLGIARPYAYGVAFILWQLSAMIDLHQRPSRRALIQFTIAAVCAAWTHYFSMMVAGLIGLMTLFWVDATYRKKYLWTAILAVAIYSIHLPITIAQFSKEGLGGPEGWLQAPDGLWVWRYIEYLGQYNGVGMAVLLIAFLSSCYAVVSRKFDTQQRLFWWTGLILWLLPLGIAWVYSHEVSPILQFSILIFGFSPFLIGLFAGLDLVKTRWRSAFALAATAVIAWGTFWNREHLIIFSERPYHGLVESIAVQNAQNIRPTAYGPMNPNFMRAYDRSRELDYSYQPTQGADLKALPMNQALDDGSALFLDPPLEWAGLLLDRYGDGLYQHPAEQFDLYTLDPVETWSKAELREQRLLGEHYLKGGEEWAPAATVALDSLKGAPYCDLHFILDMGKGTEVEGTLVCEIYRGDSLVDWYGRDLADFSISDSTSTSLYASRRLQDIIKPFLHSALLPCKDKAPLTCKVYYWNRSGSDIHIHSLRMIIQGDSPRRYGLFYDF
ncbi:MAG: hypothetical protein HKN79_09835 [Flavobacteriales bacterium]|nr:hypothetical protein [Flavobacteriales bacterium]